MILIVDKVRINYCPFEEENINSLKYMNSLQIILRIIKAMSLQRRALQILHL